MTGIDLQASVNPSADTRHLWKTSIPCVLMNGILEKTSTTSLKMESVKIKYKLRSPDSLGHGIDYPAHSLPLTTNDFRIWLADRPLLAV